MLKNMRILTSILLIFIGKSQALYPLSLERLWTKIDVAGAIERFVNGVNEYYEVTGDPKQKTAIYTKHHPGRRSGVSTKEPRD